jgi:muconate cycloisomerase
VANLFHGNSAERKMSEDSRFSAMTRIVRAEAFLVQAPFVTPYKLSYGARATSSAVMLKLTDADGNEGWGEANPYQPFTEESPEDALRVLESVLLPLTMAFGTPEPGVVDAKLDAAVPQHLCAKGAVSMALLDILGKRLRVSLSTLLGGALRSSLPVLWPLSNGTPDDDIPVIEERISQGFATFMLKMGSAPVADEVRRVHFLEERYGVGIKFIADANQGWSRSDSQQFLDGVQDARLAFLEQPLPKDDLEGMAMLAKSSALPLSADEPVTGLDDAAKIARLGAASIFSIKSSKNGGPLRAQRIAAVAKAFGIRCYMNSMLEFGITQAASLQHAVTIENLVDAGHAYMSTLRLAEDPTNFSGLVRNGVVHLPTGYGLGVEVDEARVRRMSVSQCRL